MLTRYVTIPFFLLNSSYGSEPPTPLTKFFQPPKEFVGDFGHFRSPLKFDDGTTVKTTEDWAKRRREILKYWHGVMGEWPARIEKPKLELGERERRDGVTQHRIKIETAPDRIVEDAYLLIPDGKGPFPAVIVVFYEANTGIGRGQTQFRDFAWQLVKRGFVTLSLGGDPNTYYPTKETCKIQPLSFHAYEASTCLTALANLPYVDAKRIGIVGHSYGAKWAMFASCLDERFACAAWSDGGIVIDESRGNVNYWEPWYLGFDPTRNVQRDRGIPKDQNPRTGPYKKLKMEGRDLHELHALMAPRPFLVSGGSEDPPSRWSALTHTVAVNDLLGAKNRVAMTNRTEHSPNSESSSQMYLFFDSVLK